MSFNHHRSSRRRRNAIRLFMCAVNPVSRPGRGVEVLNFQPIKYLEYSGRVVEVVIH